MYYQVKQFDFNKKSKVYSQKVSILQCNSIMGHLPSGARGVMFGDQTTWSAEYVFSNSSRDKNGEGIADWVFVPTQSAIQSWPKLAGTSICIIND